MVENTAKKLKKEIEEVPTVDIDKEIEEAARLEATVSPENPVSNLVYEISITGDRLNLSYPGKSPDEFKNVVRGQCFMNWSSDGYTRKPGKFAGDIKDLAAELGHRLLAAGFCIRIYDEGIRQKAIDGTYKPEITKQIRLLESGNLGIIWRRRDGDFYRAAKRIEGARWKSPYVSVPPESGDELVDFAELYGFQFTEAAREKIESAAQSKLETLRVKIDVPTEPDTITPSMKPCNLAIPENVDIDDEFKD